MTTTFDARRVVRDHLNRDPLGDTEEVTGLPYHHPGVQGDALVRVHRYNAENEALLRSVGDTCYRMPVEEFEAVADRLGFQQAVSYTRDPDRGTEGRFLYTSDGLLLHVTTWRFTGRPPTTDGVTLFFNWEPDGTGREVRSLRFSGGYGCLFDWACDEPDRRITRATRLGYHDADRLVRDELFALAEAGEMAELDRYLEALEGEWLLEPLSAAELCDLVAARNRERRAGRGHLLVGSTGLNAGGLATTVAALRESGMLHMPWRWLPYLPDVKVDADGVESGSGTAILTWFPTVVRDMLAGARPR